MLLQFKNKLLTDAINEIAEICSNIESMPAIPEGASLDDVYIKDAEILLTRANNLLTELAVHIARRTIVNDCGQFDIKVRDIITDNIIKLLDGIDNIYSMLAFTA